MPPFKAGQGNVARIYVKENTERRLRREFHNVIKTLCINQSVTESQSVSRREAMATKGFVLYLLSGFSVAVLSVLFINDHPINQNTFSPHLSSLNNTFSYHPYGSESKTWPVSLISLFHDIIMRLFALIVHGKSIEKIMNVFPCIYVFRTISNYFLGPFRNKSIHECANFVIAAL